MRFSVGDNVSLPRFLPYPLFGRVVAVTDEGLQVEAVQCGDPRCAAEHAHQPQTWPTDDVEGARAYQPRASWEGKRLVTYNTPVA